MPELSRDARPLTCINLRFVRTPTQPKTPYSTCRTSPVAVFPRSASAPTRSPSKPPGGALKCKEPVVRYSVLRSPISAWQDLAKTPAARRPAHGTVVGSDLVTPRGLEVVLIGSAIRRAWPGVPAFRFSDALIAAGAGMGLSLARRGLRAAAVLMLRLGRHGPSCQNKSDS